MSEGCFDTNPPLSVLIYAPFVFLAETFSIKAHDAIFWGTLGIIILFVIITYRTLKSLNIFSDNERFLIALGSLCSLTIIPAIHFAERDHFIAITLLPFILTQLCITYKHHVPRVMLYFTLIIGAIALLIKPHFGLIPAFIFIHRAIKNKTIIGVIKSPDFIILSLFSIGYIGIIWIFFQDFITVILPDVLRFYLNYNDPRLVYLYTKIYAIMTGGILVMAIFTPQKDRRDILSIITLCSLLALTIFFIQMKGFTYHRLPFYAVLFPLGIVIFYDILKRKLNAQTKTRSILLMHIFIALIFASSYAFSPLRADYPTHKDYEKNKLIDYINKHCTQPCSYFMTYENMDITSQLAFYSGHTYATRFPAFWFQPAFDGHVPTATNNKYTESLDQAQKRYAQYIIDDFKAMDPSLLLILRYAEGVPTNFAERFAVNAPELIDILSTYEPIGQFSIDRAYFYRDTKYDFEYIITWDVYKKDTGTIESNK